MKDKNVETILNYYFMFLLYFQLLAIFSLNFGEICEGRND